MAIVEDRPGLSAQAEAEDWLTACETALQAGDAGAVAGLFLADGLWRDVLAFTWTISTTAGRPAIEAMLRETLARTKPKNFHIPPKRTPPRWVTRAGTDCIEALVRIRDRGRPVQRRAAPGARPARPALRLDAQHQPARDPRPRRSIQAPRANPNSTRDFGAENWSDRLARQRAFADRDPAVLVVGGGQAGLCIAARLQQLGVDTLIVDRHARVGDNWRKRYHSLTLHNEVFVNHLPYMPFPPTWPVYIPKDMLANWFESYVDALELNYWTGTELVGGSYDEQRKQWTVTLRRADGSERVMHPRHLIFATGVSSIPFTPDLPGLADFAGVKVHSGDFNDAEQWHGRKALVLGTGTSGHDVAQELQAHGADVTIIQRSRTYVVSLKEAQSVYAIYSEGIPFDDCDLLATSMPYPVLQRSYQVSTAKGREVDKALLDGARENAASACGRRGRDRLPDDVSAPRRRLLLQRRLLRADHLRRDQAAAICRHRKIRRRKARGSRTARSCRPICWCWRPATRISRRRCAVYLGDAIADKIGPVWGFDDGGELRNMWRRTGAAGPLVHRRQPGAMPDFLALPGAADQGAGRGADKLGRGLPGKS